MKIQITTEKGDKLTRENIHEKAWYRLFNLLVIGFSIFVLIVGLIVAGTAAGVSEKTWNYNP